MPNDMRNRLVKLIHHCTSCEVCHDEDIADHLLANGVILRPCKVGDVVYQIYAGRIYEEEITNVIFGTLCGDWDFDERAIGKTVFLTREDAEKALKERESK